MELVFLVLRGLFIGQRGTANGQWLRAHLAKQTRAKLVLLCVCVTHIHSRPRSQSPLKARQSQANQREASPDMATHCNQEPAHTPRRNTSTMCRQPSSARRADLCVDFARLIVEGSTFSDLTILRKAA